MSQVNPGLSSLWRSFRQKTRTMKEVHPRARNSVTNSYQFARVPTTSDDDDDDQEEVWVKRRCSQSDDISDNGNDEYDDDADRAERSSQTLTSRPRFSLTCSNTEWDGKTQWDSNSQWDSTTQWDSAVSREEAHAGCEFSSLSAMRDGHDVANSASNTEAKLDHRVTSVDVHDHHPAHPSKPDPHPVCADKADPHPARVDKLDPHPDSSDLDAARRLVAEWQQIATVVDRLIFVLYLLSTVTAYVVILAVVPANQPPVANATLDTAGTAFSFYQWTR
nr:hypothetical protein BaRGS_005071 [Batillaria attramentaria]